MIRSDGKDSRRVAVGFARDSSPTLDSSMTGLFRETRRFTGLTQPSTLLAGVSCVMEIVDPIDALFERRYAELVRALAVAFGDADAAADAVQEAFIQADRRWRTIGQYDDPAAWIRRVAINRLRNRHRNLRRRTEIIAAIRPVSVEDLTADLLDLRRAIDALPEKMRLAVCLHHVAGCTIDEVAMALDVSPGTIKSNLHDARQRLRAQMEDPRHA